MLILFEVRLGDDYPLPYLQSDHISTNCTTTDTCCLQSVNIGLMAWPRWKSLWFFKDSPNKWTCALIFELKQGSYKTYMELQHQDLSCIFEKASEKKHISCFNLHFVKINIKANFYTVSQNISKNQSNMCDPSHILVVNDLFVYLCLHKKWQKSRISKKLYIL